jgi:hypothetical protein
VVEEQAWRQAEREAAEQRRIGCQQAEWWQAWRWAQEVVAAAQQRAEAEARAQQ